MNKGNNKVKLSPIIVFTYNRPWHTRQTIEALQKNEFAGDSEIFIYSDAPQNEQAVKKVSDVRNYIKTIDHFRKVTIIERDRNLGLANSIIDGVAKIVNEYGRVIVLEDDLVTSPFFLKYMNEALNYYQNYSIIFSITGYNNPSISMRIPKDYKQDIYFNPRNSSWGWATWRDRWNKADWDVKDYQQFTLDKAAQKRFERGGDDLTDMLKAQMERRINSWAIRWTYTHFKNDGLCVYPMLSFVENIGLDGSGIHCGLDSSQKFSNRSLSMNNNIQFSRDIQVNEKIMNEFRKIFQKRVIWRFLKHLNSINKFRQYGDIM